ncbi:MAG: hypothetical protein IJZ45_09875 [Bacteroidaceae bacterium]|nr:hypothetical protein [Bacteroidaceae bacterium]
METIHFDYTYIIRYRYSEENEYQQDFYCTSNPNLASTSKELFDYFSFEDGDDIEIEHQIANDFNNGDYLSDSVVYCLNKKDLDKELVNAYIAYIKFTIERLTKDNIEQYQKCVIKDILDNLQRKCINIYAISQIIKILGCDYDENTGAILQLRQLLDADYRNNLLSQLAPPYKTKQLRYHLDKMDKVYNIKSEKSQYRIGVLMLVFSEYTELLYPNISGNLSTLLRLLSDYYGIDAPTFRKKQLKDYIDPKTGKNLYGTIKKEHISFWDNLP